jgi:2-(1,2-epoxy-1,2-dihydrophenyl)acetyl-CoA isomerase
MVGYKEMNFKTINLNIENKIASVEINRPEVLNAFNTELTLELQQATQIVKDDDDVRVVILSGVGRAFSSGADLAEREPKWDNAKDGLLNGYKPSFDNIISMPKPVIASIQGPAAGIGAAFAMSCDLRIMSEDAYILSVFSNIALVPDGGLSWLLPKYLGYGKAYEYAIEAKKIDAKECLHFSIANKVSSVENLQKDTMDWALKLAKKSPQALANTKKLMRESLSNSYLDTYNNEAEIQNDLVRSPQNIEAVTAFFEKREPNFD